MGPSLLALLPFLALTLAPVAWAAEGVLEINHTCAVQSGCFGGDSPGYPVTIDGSEGLSYRLTSNLLVPGTITHGIEVASSNVSLDLGGFAIARNGCETATVSCQPNSGFAYGVFISNVLVTKGTRVRNGSIVGMASGAVRLGPQSHVSDLRVRWNRTIGISVTEASIVERCAVHENGGHGIGAAGDGNHLADNVVTANGGTGILAGENAVVSDNVVRDSGSHGISAKDGSLLKNNTANGNAGNGIDVDGGASVLDNVANGNTGNGIDTHERCLVSRNQTHKNGGYGIRMVFAASPYRENTSTDNAMGPVNGGIARGDNYCDGPVSPSCQ